MEKAQQARLIDKIEAANEENTFVLSEYVGDELEIMDPYGGTLQTYGLCFEVMKNAIKKLINMLELQQ
jgi:protein-tyrosine phosphatase